MIINGKKISMAKEKLLKAKIRRLKQKKKKSPLLISLVAKEDKEGLLYTCFKQRAALKVGIKFKKIYFSLKEKEKIYAILDSFLKNQLFDALIIQKPAQHLIKKFFKNKKDFEIWWLTATSKIPEKKDVDCLNVANLGLLTAGLIQFYPATVKAIYYLLLKIFGQKGLKGKNIVIIGSSEILGKPLAMLLRNKEATVSLIGSSCQDLKPLVSKGEIVVSCVGKRKLITAQMIKTGAVVIDAGIVKARGKVYGDVDFAKVFKKASYITPVPGGVGPLTVISLMENVIKAYRYAQ